MSAIACLILTAAGCYFSFGLGNAWWLAWLTPIPVLWLAYGETKPWQAFFVAWAAFALGLTSLLQPYLNVFPGLLLALDILAPALLFAGARRNMAWGFEPAASSPVTYEKRHLVPRTESTIFTPGSGPRVLRNGIEPEICFDMDFPRMIRHDAVAMQPRLLAVSASEIGTHGDWSNLGTAADDSFHARDALLRSVENGVPMARTAGRGLLTLSDRYGRIVTERRTSGTFTTLVGNLPLDGRGGSTLYDRIGDLFGWLCVALGAGLVAASFRFTARHR